MEDNPSGRLDREKLLEMYSSVLSQEKAVLMVERILSEFDTDCDGNIDFLVSGLNLIK